MNLVTQILKSKINGFREKPMPVKLTLALTYSCNSRCKTCHIWKIYRRNPGKCADELPGEGWKRLINEIGKNIGWIEFTGGEPALRKDAVEVISYSFNNTPMFAGGLTTNAVSPERTLDVVEEVLEKIPKSKLFNVGISLDGIPEIHDEIRGVAGNFDKAMWLFKKLEMLEKHGNLTVHFAHTLSKYNARRFKTFYRFLNESYNVPIEKITLTLEHNTQIYGATFKKTTYGKFENDVSETTKYLIKIFNQRKTYDNLFDRVKFAFYCFYLKKISDFVGNPCKQIIPCVAGKYSAYIDPYGDVYPCTQWNFKLGNVQNNSFREIWWSEKAKEARRHTSEGKCPNCWTPCESQPSWFLDLGFLRGWW